MHAEAYYLMATLVPLGAGFLLLGIANLLLRDCHVWAKLAVASAVVALVTALTVILDVPAHHTWTVVGVLTGMSLAVAAAGSTLLAAALSRLGLLARQPLWRWGALTALGAGIVAFSLFKYESDDDSAMNDEMAFMQRMGWKPPLHTTPDGVAVTDAGKPVELHEPDARRDTEEMASLERQILDQMSFSFAVIRQNGVDDGANCHGWVFTGGKYWLAPDMVAKLLDENGYQPVAVPHVGDVVVYHDHEQITHTAVVRYLGDEAPIVEGKWGWMGVFLHPADQSPYGHHYTYFRSDRPNHLLLGLGGKPHRRTPAFDHPHPNSAH